MKNRATIFTVLAIASLALVFNYAKGSGGMEYLPFGQGTVTSVNMSVPTGLSISGNPITTSGTLALTFTGGYSIPLTASTTEGSTAYTWGDHALAGYLLSANAFTQAIASTTFQPIITAGTYDPYGQATSTKDWLLAQGNAWTGLNQFNANASTTQLTVSGTSWLDIPKIGSATYNTVSDNLRLITSVGRISGGEITDNGDGTVAVAAGTGFIKATDSDTVPIMSFDWVASSSITVANNSQRFIGVKYNSGSPIIESRVSDNYDLDTEFALGTVVNSSNEVHILNDPWWVGDATTNIIERFQAEGQAYRDNHIGGLIISVTGTRNVALTGGTFWNRLNETAIAATSTAYFQLYYRDGSGNWTISENNTQYPVTQYDDGDGGLANLGANKYANWWVWVENDGHVALMYPQAQYNTAAEAEAASIPAVTPLALTETGIFLGKIVFKQATDAPITVKSAFTFSFGSASATNHANLSSLDFASSNHTGFAGLDIANTFSLLNTFTNASTTLGSFAYASSTQAYFGTAYLPNLGTAAGTFLAVDASGQIIATTTPTSSGTLPPGTDGQTLSYVGTTLTATSTIFIKSNRNVGIGTTNPQGKLDVAGNIYNSSGSIYSGKYYDISNFSYYVSPASDPSAIFAGNVGIGTTTPAYLLDVYGNVRVDGTLTSNSFVGALTGNASTASALAVDPTDCGANTWTNAIATSGNLTCSAITYAGITAMTSANFAGLISDETGTDKVVFNTSPGFATAANPISSDGATLGTGALMWSDLFLASGSVINFNNGDVLLTHSADTLTLTLGNLTVSSVTLTVGTVAGAIDAGGATSFEMPNGASPTVDAVGECAIDTTSGQLICYTGTSAKVFGNGFQYASFSFPSGTQTATTTTATTTIALGTAYIGETWSGATCFSLAGTVTYQISDGTNGMGFKQATTTASNSALSTNNTFVADEKRYVDIGPMTNSYLSCTVKKAISPD